MLRGFLAAGNGYRSAAMALLRRPKREEPQDPEPPASEAATPPATPHPDEWTPTGLRKAAPAGQVAADEWVPQGAAREAAEKRPSSPGEWIPEGVTPRPRTRRPSRPANPAPVIEGTTADAPAEDLRLRLDALEAQLAAAERNAAAAHRPGHQPTQAEEAATAASYAELQRSVMDLRSRLDRDSGMQRSTIESLQARLAEFEDQIGRPPAYNAPAVRAATAMRLVITIALFVVIAGAPLFMTRRTTCHTPSGRTVHWSFVKPFDDKGPARCKNELGGTVVLDAVGLK